jgi:hypothetical protein
MKSIRDRAITCIVFITGPVIFCLFLLFCFSIKQAKAQEPDIRDFKVGNLQLGLPLDSVKSVYGKAEKTEILKGDFEGYKLCLYKKFRLYINEENQKIWTFEITDSSFVTQRGVHIGDSRAKIDSLYGKPGWDEKRFGRVGPYDYKFHNYTRDYVYEWYPKGWFIVFYFNDDKITRMLFYIGVYE